MAETGKSAIQGDLRVQSGDSRRHSESWQKPEKAAGHESGKMPKEKARTSKGVASRGEQSRAAKESVVLLAQAVCHCSVNTIWQWFNSWQNVCLTACALTMHSGHCFRSVWALVSDGACHTHDASIHTDTHDHVPCARLAKHTIGMGRATATNEGQSKLPEMQTAES